MPAKLENLIVTGTPSRANKAALLTERAASVGAKVPSSMIPLACTARAWCLPNTECKSSTNCAASPARIVVGWIAAMALIARAATATVPETTELILIGMDTLPSLRRHSAVIIDLFDSNRRGVRMVLLDMGNRSAIDQKAEQFRTTVVAAGIHQALALVD